MLVVYRPSDRVKRSFQDLASIYAVSTRSCDMAISAVSLSEHEGSNTLKEFLELRSHQTIALESLNADRNFKVTQLHLCQANCIAFLFTIFASSYLKCCCHLLMVVHQQ